jgi:predicted transcriptional regulator
MEDLIKALQIMLKRGNVNYPTHCEHDTLYVYPKDMNFTDEELAELEELGFHPETEYGEGFYSFKYGSC